MASSSTLALIINGTKAGHADHARLQPAMERCSLLGDYSCERSPAVFVNDQTYKNECGVDSTTDNTMKHVKGCKLAHKKALETVVSRNERTLVLEDDFGLPQLGTGEIRSHIATFSSDSKDADIAYVGHYPCPSDMGEHTRGKTAEELSRGKCTTHAMLITPQGAAKILKSKEVDWCGTCPIDVHYHNMCISGELKCSFAPDAPPKATASQADGILHQTDLTPVRKTSDFW